MFCRPNKSSPFYPPPSNVTFLTLHSVYEYSHYKLWLAYGLAVAASGMIVILGLVIMYLSGTSYSNNFSSLLCLSRGARLSRKIVESDYDGNEPLPKYLEKAKINFAGGALSRTAASGNPEYVPVPTQALDAEATKHEMSVDVEPRDGSPSHSHADRNENEATQEGIVSGPIA